jgi:hypothetical protein
MTPEDSHSAILERLAVVEAKVDKVSKDTIDVVEAFHAAQGAFTVLGNTTAAGTGVAIPTGKTVTVWTNGTAFAFQNNHISSLTLATDLAVADGGTGASDAGTARTNLGVTATGADTAYAFRANNLSDLASAPSARTNIGLGSIATQNSNAVSVTGGSVTGITDITVADGGTGASDAATARTNLGLVIGTDVPSPTGTGASGTWGINVSGNAATATSATSAGKISAATWTVEESGGVLYFKVSGVNKAKLDSSGNLTVVGNVTAYGSV